MDVLRNSRNFVSGAMIVVVVRGERVLLFDSGSGLGEEISGDNGNWILFFCWFGA